MNLCRDCNSEYTTPGTCNCFAPGGKRHFAPPAPVIVPCVPYVPTPWLQPPITPYPWWGTITVYRDSGAPSITTTGVDMSPAQTQADLAAGRASYTIS